jgi:SecY
MKSDHAFERHAAKGLFVRWAGIVPYINASIILQLLGTALPSLKKLQREEGPQVLEKSLNLISDDSLSGAETLILCLGLEASPRFPDVKVPPFWMENQSLSFVA